MKKWRMLYDGIEPFNQGVATYRVLLDPEKIHRYVERALHNQRQKVKLGPLQIRIVKEVQHASEGKETRGEVLQMRRVSDAGIQPLRKMRHTPEREAGRGSSAKRTVRPKGK